MHCSMSGFLVFDHLLEFAQSHVYWVDDAIQWAQSLSPSPLLLLPSIFPNIRSFPMNCLFASHSQGIGASASTWVLPMSVQDWFPLGLTGLISLLFNGLSRVFFSTTVQKYQFFSVQLSLWSNSHICTWLLKKTIALTILPQVAYFLTNTTTFPLLRED